MEYLNAFLCGGVLCAIGQILIDKTKLTPARILTGYVVAGVILSAVGLYQPIADWGGAGATVPLTGFGHALAKGVREAVASEGVARGSDRRTHRQLLVDYRRCGVCSCQAAFSKPGEKPVPRGGPKSGWQPLF